MLAKSFMLWAVFKAPIILRRVDFKKGATSNSFTTEGGPRKLPEKRSPSGFTLEKSFSVSTFITITFFPFLLTAPALPSSTEEAVNSTIEDLSMRSRYFEE